MSPSADRSERIGVAKLEHESAARRACLAAEWPRAEQAGVAMGLAVKDASRVVTKLRLEGRLLGVYMVEPEHHWRYPSWQFDRKRQPTERLADILTILHQHGPYLDEQGRMTGWSETVWFMAGHELLGGRPPCEVLHDDPEAVVKAARVEYIGEAVPNAEIVVYVLE